MPQAGTIDPTLLLALLLGQRQSAPAPTTAPSSTKATPLQAGSQMPAAPTQPSVYNDPTAALVMGIANLFGTGGEIASQPGSTGATVGQAVQNRYGDFLYNRALANALAMYGGSPGGMGTMPSFI